MKKLLSVLTLLAGLSTASFAGNSTTPVSTAPKTEQAAAARVLYASSAAEAKALVQREKAANTASDICIDIYDFTDVIIIIIYDC